MSIVDKLNNIAQNAADQAVIELFYVYMQQAQAIQPGLAQVTNVAGDGVTLTVQADDGTTQTVTLANGQPVGLGSYVAINNGLAFAT